METKSTIQKHLRRPSTWFFQMDDLDRGDFWGGDVGRRSFLASLIYLAIAIGAPIAYVLFVPKEAPRDILNIDSPVGRVSIVIVGLIVSAALPYYYWCETIAFDKWITAKSKAGKISDEDERRQRVRFELNAANAKAFWAGIIAVYAVILLAH